VFVFKICFQEGFMKRHFVALSLVLCWTMVQLSIVPASFAQTSTQTASALPRLVRFGGIVKDGNANPLTGVVGLTFGLYSEQTGGAPLWLETQNVTPDGNGHYVVLLGSTKPDGLPAEIFTSEQARWVGVQVTGQAEQPRVLLVSAPYALKAGDAETVGGLPPSAFVLAAPPVASPTTTGAPAQPGNALPAGAVTGSGTADYVPLWTSTSNIGNSVLFQSGSGKTAKVGINTITPASTLDVKGAATIRGLFSLPAAGTATATKGYNSEAEELTASAFNSGTGTAVTQNFQWQVEPLGNDSSTANGALHLLFGQGTNKLTETGLNIASNGQITFATGQAFPGTGDGTVTSVGSGAGLTGGPITGSGTLSIATGGVTNAMLMNPSLTVTAGSGLSGGGAVALGGSTTLNLASNACASGSALSALPFTCSPFATLGANNFTGNEGVTGNVTASGEVQGGVVNATTSFDIGGLAFAFGSDQNAFLGFAGNSAMTGQGNTATGYQSLYFNTSGSFNTANGLNALYDNTASNNTATGFQALVSNTTGRANTAFGNQALYLNITGALNTAVGDLAGPDVNSTNLSNSTAIGTYATVSENNALVLGQTTPGVPGDAWVNVGIGTAVPRSVLEANVGVASGLGPTVTLTNSAGGTGASDSLDFNTYTPSTVGVYNPAARISAVDQGNYSDAIVFQSNIPGLPNSGLQTNMTITPSGVTGLSSTVGGNALTGSNTAKSGASNGVYGYSESPAGSGVVGINYTTSGNGVYGQSNGSSGIGVYGTAGSFSGIGTFGQSGSLSATGSGLAAELAVLFLGDTIGGSGVWGDGGSPSGAGYTAGVIGTVDDGSAGIFASNSSSGGPTLLALNNNSSGYPLMAYNDTNHSYCYVSETGSLNCVGAEGAVVPIDGGARKVALSAIESPKNWFEDFGSAQLSRGSAVVAIDSEFAQTVNTSTDYMVIPVPNGDCKGLYVTRKTPTSFEVRELGGGTSSIRFDYRIVVLRKSYENIRFADHTNDPDPRKMMLRRNQSGRPEANPAMARVAPLVASQPPAIETRAETQPLAAPPNVKSRAIPAPLVKPASGLKRTAPRK
jgi:hypothetical protein